MKPYSISLQSGNSNNDEPEFVQKKIYILNDDIPNDNTKKSCIVYQNKRNTDHRRPNILSIKRFKKHTNEEKVINEIINEQTIPKGDEEGPSTIYEEVFKVDTDPQTMNTNQDLIVDQDVIQPINQPSSASDEDKNAKFPIDPKVAQSLINQQIINEKDAKPTINEPTKYLAVDKNIVELTSNRFNTRYTTGKSKLSPTEDISAFPHTVIPISIQSDGSNHDNEPTKETAMPINETQNAIVGVLQMKNVITIEEDNIHRNAVIAYKDESSKIRVNICPEVLNDIPNPAVPDATSETLNASAANLTFAEEACNSGEIVERREMKVERVEEPLVKEDPVSVDDFIANTDEVALPVSTACPNCKVYVPTIGEHKCPFRYLECVLCNTKAATFIKYTQHFKNHGMRPRQCPGCRKILRQQSMVFHVQTHLSQNYDCPLYEIKNMHTIAHNARTYSCSMCGQDVQRSELLSHWEGHVLNKESSSEEIDKNDSSNVKAHWKSECNADRVLSRETHKELLEKLLDTRKKSGICIVCEKTFNRSSDLKRHIVEHLLVHNVRSNDSQLKCDICEKEMGQSVMEYKSHMRAHAGLMLYECHLCNKAFSDASNFCKHKKVHGIMYMQCDVCNRKFASRKMLEQHIQFHMTSSPLVCDECDKVFYYQSALRRHKSVYHNRNRTNSFRCSKCNKRFNTMKGKWDHQWLEHSMRKTKADCPLCHEGYRNASQLRVHLQTVHSEPSRSVKKKRKRERKSMKEIVDEISSEVKIEVKEEPVSSEEESLLNAPDIDAVVKEEVDLH